MKSIDHLRVQPDQLRWRCDPARVRPSVEVEPAAGPVGQQRAIAAIEHALAIDGPDTHLFVAGPPGSGRRTVLDSVLRTHPRRATPCDYLYAYDFDRPDRPRLLTLPAGRGRELVDAIDQLADKLAASKVDRKKARALVRKRTEALSRRFEIPALAAWLERLRRDVDDAWADGERRGEDARPEYGGTLRLVHQASDQLPVVRDPDTTPGALLGTVDAPPEDDPDAPVPIHGGALLEADGGVVVVDAADLFADELGWATLKRALRSGRLAISGADPRAVARPEAIPLRTRVVLVGTMDLYQQTCEADPEFRELFAVLADLDEMLPRDDDGIADFCAAVAAIIHRDDLPPLDAPAMAAVVEAGARWSPQPSGLTTSFSRVSRLLREAARIAGGPVSKPHVDAALASSFDRAGLTQETYLRDLRDRQIILSFDGAAVGEVLGLVTFDIADEEYGVPARITATAGPGPGEVASVERQAKLSGPLHDKGVAILVGLLRQRYARRCPLSLAASLCFEQSDTEVDGDSASLAEAIALISAITMLPTRQALAFTGSIDQTGRVQPIGGVEAKIEGVLRACRAVDARGGVVIPRRNLAGLMLDADVVEAVTSGELELYAVDHLDDALALAIDAPDVTARTERALAEFAEIARAHR